MAAEAYLIIEEFDENIVFFIDICWSEAN